MSSRDQLASLWRKVARSQVPAALAHSGSLLQRGASFDLLPQPGYVGKGYRDGCPLVLALNPAKGGDGISADDLTQYKLIRALKNASGPTVVIGFEALMAHLAIFMPRWKVIENNGINEILRAQKADFEEIAYLNVCKWRTDAKHPPNRTTLDDAWRLTSEQRRMLNPGRTIVLGKTLWDWYLSRGLASPGDVCIQRTIGDGRMADEAKPVVRKLKRQKLFPRYLHEAQPILDALVSEGPH